MSPLEPTVELRSLVSERVEQFTSVPADPDSARRQLVRIEQEELLAVMLQSHQAFHADLDALHRTAHTFAYDAARKAVDAVLLAIGIRVTRQGGHHTTVAAAEAILLPPPPSRRRNALAFARARTVRHEDEYPRGSTRATVTLRERREQTQNCIRLVNDCRELLGLHRVDELVPTDERLRDWTPPAAQQPP
jgi:hypothetical protein